MSEEKHIRGFQIMYDEDAREGVYHLENHLDGDEAKVYFGYAREHGEACFEDREGRKYVLAYKNGTYFLSHR